jgi:hypothetical protein
MLGLALHADGDHRESVSALEHASILVVLRSVTRVCLAIGYGKIGKAQLSRESLRDLICGNELSATVLVEAAAGLDAVGAPGLAVQACRRAIEGDPWLAQAYYGLGFYSARCGRPPEITIALARKAISLEPQNTAFRIGLASLLKKLGREPEAYAVVKALNDAQIRSVICVCCVERMIPVFESSGDSRRAALCREQLLSLSANPSPSITDRGVTG